MQYYSNDSKRASTVKLEAWNFSRLSKNLRKGDN